MISLTKKEREALLILLKDYTSYYNANSISKPLGISHVGAQKILKGFKGANLTLSRTIGKSIVHKPNLQNDYARKLVLFLLADEANNFKRWQEEFKALSKKEKIVLFYGSAMKNYQNARDIDIMIVVRKNEFANIRKIIKETQQMLPKKIHLLLLAEEEFLNNVKNRDKAMVSIIKDGIVLFGQEKYLEAMENVAGF